MTGNHHLNLAGWTQVVKHDCNRRRSNLLRLYRHEHCGFDFVLLCRAVWNTASRHRLCHHVRAEYHADTEGLGTQLAVEDQEREILADVRLRPAALPSATQRSGRILGQCGLARTSQIGRC